MVPILDEETYEESIDILLTKDTDIMREKAAFTLGYVKDNRAVNTFIQLLEELDPKGNDQFIFEEVARSLGRIQDIKGNEILLKKLKKIKDEKYDYVESVRGSLIDALGYAKEKKALPLVLEIMKSNTTLIYYAADFLFSLLGNNARSYLEEYLEHKNESVRKVVRKKLKELMK